jgi:hypothetical protein
MLLLLYAALKTWPSGAAARSGLGTFGYPHPQLPDLKHLITSQTHCVNMELLSCRGHVMNNDKQRGVNYHVMYEFGNSYFWISFVLSRRSWCLCTRCRGLCVHRASRRPGSGAPWGILRGWAAPVWSRVFGSINAQPSQQSPDANEMYLIGLHESSAKWESRGKCATKRQLLFKIAAGL